MTVILAACSNSASAPAKPTAAGPAAPTTAPAAKPTDAAKTEAAKPAPTTAPVAAKPAADNAKIAEQFAGKTIDLYIGYAPGGGYDIRGRIFAEYFSRHMPGNPKVAIQNLAGGGGLQATRQVMRAKPDGLTMVTIPSGVFLLDLLGEKQEGFDRKQPLMLGNYEVAANQFTPLWARTELGTSWDEVLKKGQQLKYGAPAVGNSQALAGEWLSIVGAPVKVVYGYGGSNELLAAIDRKEVDLMAVDDLAEDPEASLPRSKQAFPEWFTTNPKYITPVLATLGDPAGLGHAIWMDDSAADTGCSPGDGGAKGRLHSRVCCAGGSGPSLASTGRAGRHLPGAATSNDRHVQGSGVR